MSSILDGLSEINSIDTQINSLKNSTSNSSLSKDPDDIALYLQKSFDSILTSMLSSSKSNSNNSLFSNLYSIESQISLLKNQADSSTTSSQVPSNPNTTLINLQQYFNTMINNFNPLTDEEINNNDEEEEFDPFASFLDYQTQLTNLNNQTTTQTNQDFTSLLNSLNVNSYTDLINPGILSKTNSEYNLLNTLYQSDVSKLF